MLAEGPNLTRTLSGSKLPFRSGNINGIAVTVSVGEGDVNCVGVDTMNVGAGVLLGVEEYGVKVRVGRSGDGVTVIATLGMAVNRMEVGVAVAVSLSVGVCSD